MKQYLISLINVFCLRIYFPIIVMCNLTLTELILPIQIIIFLSFKKSDKLQKIVCFINLKSE